MKFRNFSMPGFRQSCEAAKSQIGSGRRSYVHLHKAVARYLPVLFFMVVLQSCQESKPELAPQKMQEVLTDLYAAESYSMLTHPAADSARRQTQRNVDSLAMFYNMVFKHHNVTREQFDKSLDWYQHHPQELDSIYARMIPELTTRQEMYADQ